MTILSPSAGGGGSSSAPNEILKEAEITNIGISTPSTIVSLSIVSTTRINHIHCSGELNAQYEVVIDATTVLKGRTGSGGGLDKVFFLNMDLTSGQIIDVVVTHFYPGETVDFSATIFGF